MVGMGDPGGFVCGVGDQDVVRSEEDEPKRETEAGSGDGMRSSDQL